MTELPKIHLTFLFLIISLLLSTPFLVNSQFSAVEKTTLLNLKIQWGNPPSLISWNSTSSPCNWSGIKCNVDGTVTGIFLQSKNIVEKIPDIIIDLKNLTVLNLAENYVPGNFPTNLYNCFKLQYLDLSQNTFVGTIPNDIDRLQTLCFIDLGGNNFTGDIPPAIGNLTQLRTLSLYSNLFNGTFPQEIANLSNLEKLKMAFNGLLPAKIPPGFSKLSKLKYLWMTDTQLVGSIPPGFPSLEHLDLSSNDLDGEIPEALFLLKNLRYLLLLKNKFLGSIPSVIKSFNLIILDLSMNRLTGTIPEDLGKLDQLGRLELSYNKFTGNIPMELTSLSRLVTLRLDGNSFSGELPSHMISCKSLSTLNLARNKLTGSIPATIGSLPGLIDLDLSDNQFSGLIPHELGDLKLYSLNLSSNHLAGKIPDKLDNMAYYISFLNNPNLCATILVSFYQNCNPRIHESKKLSTKILDVVLVLSILVFLFTITMTIFLVRDYKRKKHRQDIETWESTSFHRLDFTEVNILSSLTDENTIGSGGSGKVYKVAAGRPGEYVAVKRIYGTRKLDRFAEQEFLAEVQILGSIRHANIVKLLCCISSDDSKLLVYEYLENHSLDQWLHCKKKKETTHVRNMELDWPTRLQIAIGAGQGLCYMHHDCSPPIIQRDVKSSNILLDSEFKAKIADFGLAKILHKRNEANTMSTVAGTFGYIAPEYAYTSKVNEKIDVYSFGVVLLELVTGLEANDGVYLSLTEWAWKNYGDGTSVEDAIDKQINEPANFEGVSTVFRLGLICTSLLPSSRPSMKVVNQVLLRCKTLEGNGGERGNTDYDVTPLLGGD